MDSLTVSRKPPRAAASRGSPRAAEDSLGASRKVLGTSEDFQGGSQGVFKSH